MATESALAETGLGQCAHYVAAGDDGEAWAPAGMSISRDDRGILELELEGLSRILQCVLDALALACDFDLKAAGNVPGWLLNDGGGESHY
ncbi:MAG: hypothetical protein ACRDWA_05065 [Acidimicrobiia bacterium]